MLRSPKLLLLGCWACLLAATPIAQSSAQVVADKAEPFATDVLPILKRQCFECHDVKSPEAELNLSSLAGLLAGSAGGPVITPGKSQASLLMQVLDADADPHMPPEGQLTPAEAATLAAWIDRLDPATPVGGPRITQKQREHWAFQPLARPAVPEVDGGSFVRTPIDNFVLARLQAAGLRASPAADKATLLRRIYFDLIGLPPGPEEVAAFLADDRDDAFERVVDRLLASPQYGERWGRHWLDLARYADSSGFHNDFDRPHAWRYRDYVIDSFNADKPYGQFIREQLAGDQLSRALPPKPGSPRASVAMVPAMKTTWAQAWPRKNTAWISWTTSFRPPATFFWE